MAGNLAIRIEDGVLREVVTDGDALVDAPVTIIEDGIPGRVVTINKSESLSGHAEKAEAATTAEGICLAMEIAGERITALTKQRHDDPVELVNKLADIVEELGGIVKRLMAEQPAR